MKRALIPLLVLISTNSLALADSQCSNALCHIVNSAMGVTLAPIASSILSAAATTGGSDQKQAYVAALQDDAAMYLADGGEASALLQGAFESIKAQFPDAKELSDEALAALILGSN